jgi:hypothetical protein
MSDVKSKTIEEKLRQAWRSERRFYNLRGLARFLIWVVVMIVLDFLIDWGIFFRSRMSTRIGYFLLAINAAVLIWILWREWLRHLKRFDPVIVALEVESRHPELSSMLVSYIQFQGPVTNQPDISMTLLDAMKEEAVNRTRPLDFREVVDFGQLKRLLIVAFLVLAGFGTISAIQSGHLQSLFMRLIGLDVKYPTRTQIQDVTGDVTVRAGDPLTITATVRGVVPQTGRIYFRSLEGDTSWQVASMERSRNQPIFKRHLPEANQDLLYYVRIGDDQTDEFRMTVVSAPRVVKAEIKLKYPKYMNRQPGQSDNLNLTVPEGTELEWNLKCEPAVKAVQVTFGEEDSADAEVDATGTKITFTKKAGEGFKYTFHWTEGASGKNFEYDDVQYTVRVTPDQSPDVELLEPVTSGLATVMKTQVIRAQAADDHGLSKAWLVYSIDGSRDKRIPIHTFQGVTSEEVKYKWSLKETLPDLKPGVQISFAVEVCDLYEPKAHRSRSIPRKMTIVDVETYLQWYREELAAQRDEIKRAKDSEEKSSTQVKQLKEQEAKSP